MKIQTKYKYNEHTSEYYVKDKYHNLTHIDVCLSWLNHHLKVNKFVTLNEFLGSLGMELKPYGFRYGWIFKEDNFVGLKYQAKNPIKKARFDPENIAEPIEFELIGLENIEKTWFDAYKSGLK